MAKKEKEVQIKRYIDKMYGWEVLKGKGGLFIVAKVTWELTKYFNNMCR